MANTKKRTTVDTLGAAMAARQAGRELDRNAVVSALAQASDRDEKAKSYQAQKAAEAAQKAQEAARAAAQAAAEQEERRKAATEGAFQSSIGQKADIPKAPTAKESFAAMGQTLTQKQLDNAAVKNAEKNANAATKAYDTYMKSEERKTNVDAATNDVLKKVFGNLGSGNLDLSLQNAPKQMLGAETKEILDKEEELKAKKDYAERQEQTAKDTRTLNTDMAELRNWSKEDKAGLEAYIREEDNLQNRQNWDVLSNSTNPESTALIQKYGIEKVREMAESYRWQQSNQLTRQAQQDGVDGANKSVLSAVGHNVGSVGANLLGAVSAPLGYVQELGQRTGRYTTLNPNNIGQLPSVYASGVRGQTAENIEKSEALRRFEDALAGAAGYTQNGEIPGMKVNQPEKEGDGSTLGKAASTVYQAGMTAADSVARAATGGGGTVIPGLLAAGQSFGSTVSQASRQGASPTQALSLGAVNAGIEAATEKYSLENLLSTAKHGSSGIAGMLKNAAIQAGVETSEEEASLAGTTLAERLILGGKSSYDQQIQEGLANGMSYAQAKAAADKGLLTEAGETGLISALSGGMSSFGADAANRIGTKGSRAAADTDIKTEKSEASKLADQLLKGLAGKNTDTQTNQADTADGNQRAKSEQLDAAIKDTLGIPVQDGNVDTGNRKDYNNIINEKGAAAYGQNADDRAGGTGDPAQGMAGVQQGDRYATGGREEHGGVAQHSGVVRVSEQLRNARENRGVQSYDLYETSNSPEEYEQALQDGRNSDPKNGWCVTPKTAQELADGNIRTAMNDNRTVGVGVAPDGDIVAVFKNKNGGPRKALDTAMPVAIEMGGDRLDCYGDGLVNVYENYGFIPVAKVEFNPEYANEGWTPDKGTPFIYVMMHNGDSAATVTEKMYSYKQSTQADLDALPTYGKDDYDAAIAYRDGLIRDRGTGKSMDAENSAEMGKGPDGIVTENPIENRPQGMDMERQSTEGGQEAESGIPDGFEAMGAASAGFSGVNGYDELLYDGNVQPDRANDAKHEEMPIKDGYGRKVSEFGANAINSEVISERDVNTVKQLVADGAFGHDTQKMEDVQKAAAEEINKRGKAGSVHAITTAVANGKINENMIAQAQLLFAHYSNQNGKQAQDMASELLVDLAQMATQSGRQLNMFKLLRRLTPEGQLMTVQKGVERSVQRMTETGKVKEGITPEIAPELQQEYLDAAKNAKDAKTPEEIENARKRQDDAANAIYASAAAQMETTFKGKWDAWRYMAMMGNVKTNVRNVLGNAAMIPYTEAKRAIGAAMEKAIPKDKRTKAVMGLSKDDRALMQWAKDDSQMYNVKNALQYSAKLGDDVTGSIMQEQVKVFDNPLLEGFRKITEKVPAAGDMLFKNREYSRSLAGFLKARGYSYADIQNGNISAEVLSEARDYSINEAMKATFNDCNAFSDFISSLRYTGDNVFGKALNTLGEGVMPFRRTPANIVVRFTEYSPVGIAKGLGNLATKVSSGEMSAATAIDQLSAGLTGTGAAALGYMLASMGILKGSGVSEEEEEQGHQAYSLEFTIDGKEYSYTIDWAAPANLPLFLGANMYELFDQQGDGSVSAFTNFAYSMGTMFEPMLPLSCLSSLNDLFETGKYAGDGEVLYSVASQAATSYLTQGIPSLVRQAYQAAHENKQQTFANSSDPLLRDAQRTAANVPFLGDAFQVDSVDEWGNAVSRGDAGQRVFDAFANPGTLKQVDNSDLETEISRLGDAQAENVRPPEVPKTISYTDADGNKHTNDRLTGEQYTTLKTVQGRTAKSILDAMISGDDYKALTDEQKAEAFGYAYDYAREKARTEAIEGYEGLDGWMDGIAGKEAAAIVNKVGAADISDAMSAMTSAWKEDYDDTQAREALESAFQVYDGMSDDAKKSIRESATGRLDYYLDARAKGIKTETFIDLYKTYWEIDQSNANTSEKAQKWAYELERAEETRKINARQKAALKDSMVYYQMFPAGTEKFDQLTESGLSAKSAQDLGYLLNGLVPQSGYKQVRDVQKAEAIMSSTMSEADKVAALKVYGSDAQDEKLEEMTGMGFSAADYVEAWRIYSDESGTGKKARTIAKYQKEFGVDEETARAIYDIYG